jgi:hypothetical protein
MGRDPLGWIGETEPATPPEKRGEAAVVGMAPRPVAEELEVGEMATAEKPKFLSYEVMTARLRSDQIDFLSALERQIMRSRDQKGERITKNSLLRAAVDLLEAMGVDLQGVGSEDELRERVLGGDRDAPEGRR